MFRFLAVISVVCVDGLREGDVCYRFCEDGSLPPVSARERCDEGLKCTPVAGIRFDSCTEADTCQAPMCQRCGDTCVVEGDMAGICDSKGDCSFDYAAVEEACARLKKTDIDGSVSIMFPKSWGQPPNIQTMDYRPLPGGYGHGSSTLFKWIEAKMCADRAQQIQYPPAFGAVPRMQTRDYRPLPFGYGHGSGTLATWLRKKAQELYGEESVDFVLDCASV